MEKVDLTDLGVSKHMTPDGVATLTYLAESIQKYHLNTCDCNELRVKKMYCFVLNKLAGLQKKQRTNIL